MLGDTFSQTVVNRWNSLDQETVDVGSINSFKGKLDKIRKTGMGFLWILHGPQSPRPHGDRTTVRPHKVSHKVSHHWAVVYSLLVSVYLSCVTQITVTWVQHQRPTPTVHLAGSFVLGHRATALDATRRALCNDVLTLVSLTTDVQLLSGEEAAGYLRVPQLVNVNVILTSRSLTSSENVTLRQVHNVITCYFTYHFLQYSASDF